MQNIIAPFGIYNPSSCTGGTLSFEEALAFVESRLHVSESFRECLVRVPFGIDRPWWLRDPNFDLE